VRNCVICGESNWENIDSLRVKPEDMVLCKTCGMIQINKFSTKEEIERHYLGAEYRKAPNSTNFHSGNLKLQYHQAFLGEYIKEWKDKEVSICDIGTAYGMFLHWFKSHVPKANVYGTELTESYTRNAFWEFGLRLTKEIDTSRKYDIISCYKVLEHLFDVNEQLEIYYNSLNDDGYFYVSSPEWFEELGMFGDGSQQTLFDGYFHPDHINVWSRNNHKNILKKHGFKIIKENHTIYSSTYMCVKGEKEKIEYDDPAKIKENVIKIKQAIDNLTLKKPKEAVELWPNYPEAWLAYYEFTRKEIHAEGAYGEVQKFIEKMLKACNTPEINSFAGELCRRYKQFDKAKEYFQIAIDMRPNSPNIIRSIANLYHDLYAYTKDYNYLLQARDAWGFLRNVYRNEFDPATNWIYGINSSLPIPNENNK